VESVEIAPEALEDVEMLQDLVTAAVNDALSKSQEMATEKLNAITGGMNIPGLT
jgi:DNA-binding protein YbaB